MTQWTTVVKTFLALQSTWQPRQHFVKPVELNIGFLDGWCKFPCNKLWYFVILVYHQQERNDKPYLFFVFILFLFNFSFNFLKVHWLLNKKKKKKIANSWKKLALVNNVNKEIVVDLHKKYMSIFWFTTNINALIPIFLK